MWTRRDGSRGSCVWGGKREIGKIAVGFVGGVGVVGGFLLGFYRRGVGEAFGEMVKGENLPTPAAAFRLTRSHCGNEKV